MKSRTNAPSLRISKRSPSSVARMSPGTRRAKLRSPPPKRFPQRAIAVRSLSLSHVRLGPFFTGELRTGLLIAMVLAALAFPMVWAVFGDVRLAAAIAAALAAASTLASVLGLVMPWLLDRAGFDPAYGSGPIATIVQDMLSLAIYFGCVSVVLGQEPGPA